MLYKTLTSFTNKLLEDDTTIKEVIFCCNHITDDGAAQLAQMLKVMYAASQW